MGVMSAPDDSLEAGENLAVSLPELFAEVDQMVG
jgi:hypothetical protein